jgi:hypothetical protein
MAQQSFRDPAVPVEAARPPAKLLSHSYVYYLIFPPDTAPVYRACAIRISTIYIWQGILAAIAFSFLMAKLPMWMWVYAIAIMILTVQVVSSILTLAAARRSEDLDRATVSFLAAANYAGVALFVWIAIWTWPFWFTVVFWGPMMVLFHGKGLAC